MPRFYIRNERQVSPVRKFKVYHPWWVDPNWWLSGSSIEKMVMAELERRGVYFIYRNQTNDLGGFVDPSWEADFYLPQHKIWIEVQGSYFHTLPGQLEKDSLRYAAIEMAGWTPLFLWEFDIRSRLPEMLDQVGVFYQVNLAQEQAARKKYGANTNGRFQVGPVGATKPLSDQLVGLRKALSARTRPPQYAVKRRKRRMPK